MKNKFDIKQFINVETQQSITTELVARFCKRRKEKGLTQREIAEKAGVSYSSLRRFEQTGEISFGSLLKLAKTLNCLEDFNALFKNPIIGDLKDYKND